MSKSANVNAVRVVVENVVQDPSVAYTCSGTTLSFTSAPPTGTNNIYVVHLGPPAATVAPPTTINNATTFTDDVTVGDDLLLNSDSAVLSIGEDADLKITHDGTNGDFESAGDLTLDVAGDIILDADGGDIKFKDAGTEIGSISLAGSNVILSSAVSDEDIIFKGNDGGSTIDALTLDMSEAGTATFNNNVGIGLSPTDSFGFTRALDIGSTGGAFVYVRDTDATNATGGIGISGNRFYLVNKAAGPMTFQVNGDANERMRINEYGYVGIGRTDPVQRLDVSAGTTNQWAGRFRHDGFGGTNYFLDFDRNGGGIGSITGNGSNVSYNTSSDYRLKENIVDLDGATARLKQLQPRRFNFIDNDSLGTIDGFIAHEAQEVVPEAVTGTKDAMTEEVLYVDGDEIPEGKKVGDVKTASTIRAQGIDQSKLVPLLTSALQEAIGKIETLETENTAIKSRLDALEAG
jgi:hypothetical protein